MEVGYALQERKPVIPLRFDSSQYGDEIRLDLSRRDYIDISSGIESSRQRLKNALELQRLKSSVRSKVKGCRDDTANDTSGYLCV
jgi:nucleoside 2-deoxyribosyltransferase